MEWAEDQELHIDPATSVTRRTEGCTTFLLRGRREKLSTSSTMWRARTAARLGESFVDEFLARPAEKRRHLTRKSANPTTVEKLNEVIDMVEKREMNIGRWEADFKEVFSNGLKSAFW